MKCENCQIGTYCHSASEDAPLFEDWEMDGMGCSIHPTIYKFCPWCGIEIDIKHREKARRNKIMNRWFWRKQNRCKHEKVENYLCTNCEKVII